MPATPNFEIEMVKLQSGARVMRVGDPLTGTWLERPLNPALPVVKQKQVLERALANALKAGLSDPTA